MATWSHTELSRRTYPWGIEVEIRLTRDGTGEQIQSTVCFDDETQITSQGPTRLARMKWNAEAVYSALNDFDIGDESREILFKIVKWIRNHPTATIDEAKTAFDTAYADSVFKADKFFSRAREWLMNELGYTPTWDQFKTYVINNIFKMVDNYDG